MTKLDWEKPKARYRENPTSHTKRGKEFRIVRITECAIFVGLQSGDEYIGRENLEKAVALLNEGELVNGPGNYRTKVNDQRPAYAWAILRDMGFVQGD